MTGIGEIKVLGVSRDVDNERVLVIVFNQRPSDDEMRYLHEAVREIVESGELK